MQIKRLLTAAVLVPVFYLYIAKLPGIWFDGLAAAMGMLALWEFLHFYGVRGVMKLVGMGLGLFFLAAAALSGPELSVPFLRSFFFLPPGIYPFLLLAAVTIRLFKTGPSFAMKDISPVMLALLYIPGLIVYQMFLRDFFGTHWVIFLYGTVWIGDSAALYAGRSLGKRKLYPEVSPNKTVAGAIGSVIGGSAAGFAASLVFKLGISSGTAALLGLLMGTTAIAGDLVESMFKRDAGVKDSGSFLPGHGGMLDKLDGPLFSAPILYWGLLLLGVKL